MSTLPIDSSSSADEQHPPRLASQAEQLRKALLHWQTWDAEYEALKEEVEAAPEQAGQAEELSRIHLSFEGSLLHGKEVDEIFGLQTPRSKRQVVNLLQRRIDYVTTNITSLKKQLDAELAHAGVERTFSSTDLTDEGELPITEIFEQLDENGNVLESHLNRADDSVSRVNEMLENAVTRAQLISEAESAQNPGKASAQQPGATRPAPPATQIPSANSSESTATRPSRKVKKKVSFADDTKPAADSTRQPSSTVPPPAHMSRRAQYLQNIMKDAKDQENISSAEPFIPEDEDEEDAALRQQMLKYGMGEVGAIVAELRLEEGNGLEDDVDYFDMSGDETLEDDEEDEEEEEDSYGRATSRLISDEYRQRMRDLEARLGVQSHHSQAAAEQNRSSSPSPEVGIGRIVVNPNTPTSTLQTESRSSLSQKPNQPREAKSVHFAPDLDVAPDTNSEASMPQGEAEAGSNPLGDVVERCTPSRQAESTPPARLSRFRKAAQANQLPSESSLSVPSDAVNVDQKSENSPQTNRGPLADRLVEKDTLSAPAAPDELDDTLDQGALADEYHRLRRKFIHRQGGFLKEDESPIQPLDESEGGPPRMSRFKAARLSQRSFLSERKPGAD